MSNLVFLRTIFRWAKIYGGICSQLLPRRYCPAAVLLYATCIKNAAVVEDIICAPTVILSIEIRYHKIHLISILYNVQYFCQVSRLCVFLQESPANAKGTRDSSACMKAHCCGLTSV